ncbi:MAG TPA: hypothetical protein EYH45_02250 [Candidatus Caldiarchaeum subterraneum]|uniref:Uncharacterized protein n=1 Tax=Caldiarchaeum subterraneum TaxID=311458 RepID=A0A832ZV18_CALS0|nr:hypothetical protein [Candidatus Caldarchaeum subterraneum]
MWEKSLMAYKEDIKSRSWVDWLKAHTSFFKPLHRYEGVLELTSNELVFNGKDVKENKEFQLKIQLRNIIDVYYGFDDVFKGREERAWPWNKPLRIKYQSENGEKTIYLFARFHHRKGIRASDNKEVYRKLKEIMMRGVL